MNPRRKIPGPAHPDSTFKGLGDMGAHMSLLATYPLHVNGAYLSKRDPLSVLRELNVYSLA